MKRKIFVLCLLILIITIYKTNDEYAYIPNEAIRLRVIPNSNDPTDINIKEKVKSYLENNLYNLTKDIGNIDEARNIIKQTIPKLNTDIDNLFLTNEYYLPYHINYGYNYFPEKYYKGKYYKEGLYESIVLTIGAGEGDNWWCVLFPNFCLIDTKKHQPKSLIKKILNDYSKKSKEE